MLDYVLNKTVWTPYGIECSDHATAKKVHKFMREAVLDRHICIRKVIGFSIHGDNGNKLYSGTYIARHINMGDSYPELAVVYSDKVFMTTANQVNLYIKVGETRMSYLAIIAKHVY